MALRLCAACMDAAWHFATGAPLLRPYQRWSKTISANSSTLSSNKTRSSGRIAELVSASSESLARRQSDLLPKSKFQYRKMHMLQVSPIETIAHVIQLAVAPVFLLTGIAGMLSVMTNRLSRIVDRARVLELAVFDRDADNKQSHAELACLSRRARLISTSISLCTLTALLVSAVIAILFLGSFVTFDASMAVALLFVTAMLVFIIALLFFLREVLVAIAGLRFGIRQTDNV